MPPFTVAPPDGGRPGCADAIILNLAVFAALPSGLLTIVGIAHLLPEWVGRDYGMWLAFGAGVPIIVGYGLLYHRLAYALLGIAVALRRPSRRRPPPARPPVGTITIDRGGAPATLAVDTAAMMMIDHPGGTDLLVYLHAPSQAGEGVPADPEGSPHPGASLQVFQTMPPAPPEMLAIRRDLEDPSHHVPHRGEGGPLSILRDYEPSTIVRFQFRVDADKSRRGYLHLEGQARTAGGPGGEPPPIRIDFSCLAAWKGHEPLGERSWSTLLKETVWAAATGPPPRQVRPETGT